MRRWRSVVAVGLLLAAPVRADDDGIDSDLFRDPELPVARVVTTYPEGLVPLWLQALDRPEVDLQSRVALSIALAHEQGMPGLAATVPPLLRVLDRPDLHPAVRAAVARALVVLDARDASPALLRLVQAGDPDVNELAEPALARWGYRPAASVWLDRLNRSPLRRSTVLAMDGLAALREEAAAPRLRELALSADVPPPYRIAAARALAVLRPAGGEADARQLSADASPRGLTGRLVAATLLRQHQGPEAVAQLQGFARDAEPAVATVALARLAELNPDHVLAVLGPVLSSPDGGVRRFGLEAMLKRPSAVRVQQIGDLLADPHPDVRVRARQALRELAGGDLRNLVLTRATVALNAGDWRGQEQAALLLGRLGHKPAADRLAGLLASDRPEVAVAAAWGLRVLAVPGTLPAALAHVESRHRQLFRPGMEALDRQLSQLVQFLGRADHRAAEPVLRQLVPRPVGGSGTTRDNHAGGETRAAAVDVLGRWHAADAPADLVRLIEPRLTDIPTYGPDDERVRRMAAVALGRMKATQMLPSLKRFAGDDRPPTDRLEVACRWAAAQLTGDPVPPPGVVERAQRDWFLTPVR